MEALLYDGLYDAKVRCRLCRHRCLIPDGKRGLCGVRENQDGRLQTLVYGRLVAGNVDPIEKKPLYHFQPGSLSYSIATVGCNFRCRFCQNADIAQMPADRGGRIVGTAVRPEAVVRAAAEAGCRSIAYTYTEPTVFFEFALDTARLAHAQGFRNVFVTNGYMSAEALELIAPVLDAANVDLKAFNRKFYTEVCGAKLEEVQESLREMKSRGIWVEVTTLLVPGLNDDPAELKALAEFLARELGPGTPWHISRFHPTYRLTDRPPTPVATLSAAREIGLSAGLKYVYTGNVPGDPGENTYCPACGATVIERLGFRVGVLRLKDGRCGECRTALDGVWG
jgi:pyruvate formate lyase activating enzyme